MSLQLNLDKQQGINTGRSSQVWIEASQLFVSILQFISTLCLTLFMDQLENQSSHACL